MTTRILNFAVIGCGLMGREFASAAARWNHLVGMDIRPRIVAACDTDAKTLADFCAANDGVAGYADYRQMLDDPRIAAVYAAVPHDLHERVYIDVLRSGKHLMGEKPFGIDHAANARIMAEVRARPRQLVRCSSEFPFFPGALKVMALAREGKLGRVLEARCGLLHSSDMDPMKPINWKRRVATCGQYGCMGDLGMHAMHVPLRLGWMPRRVFAMLTKVVAERPVRAGASEMAPCETWDNAVLACVVGGGKVESGKWKMEIGGEGEFPLLLEMKRMAPGHVNTWFLEVYGTGMSAKFSTRWPRTLETMPYERGKPQAWHVQDLGYESAYPAITGSIFEFGFADAIQQMWAAFCDELMSRGEEGGAGGRPMRQPVTCATAEEAEASHAIMEAALESARGGVAAELPLTEVADE
jgi:predicted dehydrogenase